MFPLLATLIPTIAGAIGNIASSGQRGNAQTTEQNAFNLIQGLPNAPDLSSPIALQQFANSGSLSPALMQAIQQNPSLLNKIQEDPSLRAAQLTALNQLGQQSRTGLNASDIAAYMQMLNNSNKQVQGNIQSIMQNAQARGQAGGGAALAAQLQAAQQGANTASEQGLNIAGGAADRALQALSQYGNQAQSVRAQDFSNAQTKASAQDAINQFNAQNAMAAARANQENQMAANQYNTQNQQNIGNANVAQANQELQRQKNAQLTNWQNAVGLAGTKAGSAEDFAKWQMGQANATGQQFAGVGSGLAQGIGAYNQDQNAQAAQQQSQNNFNSLLGLLKNNQNTGHVGDNAQATAGYNAAFNGMGQA